MVSRLIQGPLHDLFPPPRRGARVLLRTVPVTGQHRPRLGSLCSGYGGLDMAVAAVFDAELAYTADPDPAAAGVLAHHHPGVPNLGDITTANLAETAPRTEIIAAGFPCQDISIAGRGAGIHGSRSIVFDTVADAVRDLRPHLLVLENVAALRRRGLGHVHDRLAACGMDTAWTSLQAAHIGAPHRRNRIFILAYRPSPTAYRLLQHAAAGAPADPTGTRRRRARADEPHRQARERALGGTRRRGQHPPAPEPHDVLGAVAAAHPARLRRGQGLTEPARLGRRPDAHLRHRPPHPAPGRTARTVGAAVPHGHDAARAHSRYPWGRYQEAIWRWEHITGHQAPDPSAPGKNGTPRLSPAFVDWLMGHAGHVTCVPGLTRNQQLRLLGNGCVPQQAEAALRRLAASILDSRGQR